MNLYLLTEVLFHRVPFGHDMTNYNIYSAYKRALAAGRKNIRFVSLKTDESNNAWNAHFESQAALNEWRDW